MSAARPTIRWAVEWRSENRLDGKTCHFLWNGTYPYLFRTRKEARQFIDQTYSFIKQRVDLRVEPHGWRTPCAVKVRVILEPYNEGNRCVSAETVGRAPVSGNKLTRSHVHA